MEYILGGAAAACAGFFSNPFDVIKTRQQLQGELQKKQLEKKTYGNVFASITSIIKAEGVLGLQKGLTAALNYQFVMNSIRLGTYQTVTNLGLTKFDKSSKYQSPLLCVVWGGISGVMASSVAVPFYMMKIQIQSQSVGEYAVGYQHKHKGTIDGFRNVIAERGVFGLWKGFTAIVPRTTVGSAVQLPTFSLSKEFFSQYDMFRKSFLLTAVGSSLVSGLFTVIAISPFDVVSTRLFNQGLDANGKGLLYNNIVDCFSKTLKIEGVRGFYKGFIANYCRTAPHTVLNLTFWEQFKKWRKKYNQQY